ncbi:sensor domain-containing diguanylate cyclase [Paenibacillus polysaccharolyticus]|uniref:sensor domain-containing diguanylate cyclase n=1 Tax=Paenibacillus polysaccharolyticus TaxID=582692 RepID=UPI0020420D0C|nr:sensor domain-containing diguanylate cyclase [Paenibacillus polysaccharolyticus]MCM3131658.1 sensor domain-containing diguanylate cyclase [Paenibacillus polysaccharolyticus]
MIANKKKSRLRRKVKKFKKVSLTALLGGFVTISVLMTLTIMVITSYTTQKQSLINNTLSVNYASAVQMSQTLNSLFESMKKSLKYGAAHFKNVDFDDKEKLNTTLDLIHNSSDYFNAVVLADPMGLVLSRSPYSQASIGTHVSSEAAKAAIKSKASYISDAYVTPRTNRRIVFLSEPIVDPMGKYKGMISGSIYLQENNILDLSFGSQLKTDNGTYFFIVDHKGTLLFHPNVSRIGRDIRANTVVQKLIKNQTGQEQYTNLDGVNTLAGYYKVPATNWGVVVVSPTQIVYDQLNRQIGLLLLYIAVPFILLTLIVLRVARKLVHPFVFLADLVQQVDKGQVELPVVKPHWNREADLLTRAVLGAMTSFRNKTDQLVYDARTDVLTGLNNRRTFEEVIQAWTHDENPFAIIVLDIDRFKLINDTYGHSTGDEVLKQIAKLIQMSVRPEDVCFRFGGEEFVVLLRDHDSKKAYEIAERIRISVEESILAVDRTVTISAGIAEFPMHSRSETELFHLADNALYLAKEEGRNRTVIIQTVEKAK